MEAAATVAREVRADPVVPGLKSRKTTSISVRGVGGRGRGCLRCPAVTSRGIAGACSEAGWRRRLCGCQLLEKLMLELVVWPSLSTSLKLSLMLEGLSVMVEEAVP